MISSRRVTAAVGLATSLALGACGGGSHRARVLPATTSVPPQSPVAAAPAAAPTQHLVRWRGPVMNIFFHPLVLQPQLAFTSDSLGIGFQEYFVTAYEFEGILNGLYRHGWTLVDAHLAASGHVMVPKGRKPLVLSEDDVNYYRYFDGRGLASRLVLTETGQVLAETPGPGRQTTDQDVVPLVDEFVQQHPDFSVGGAKGVLALTGYEGLLGYHHLGRPAQRAHVTALASALKADGWLLASHTYGHIDLTNDSLATIAYDTKRWKQLARPLIGRTDLLIYPYGARPSAAGADLLRRAGFPIQFDIDVRPHRYQLGGATVMSRLHIDGFAFEAPQRMKPLFSVRRVMDPQRPWPLGL
ncbi:MAG TPA: polysaccharide deacetylase family protein [Mycobacteriales bacterium]|nr:polysaccharide deacetylase family protein [Mycobacteriales bacterium]